MMTNLLFNFVGSSSSPAVDKALSLGFKPMFEIPAGEFLAEKSVPCIPTVIGMESYLSRISEFGLLDPHYQIDYGHLEELIGQDADLSFGRRRGMIRIVQRDKPMGSVSMTGVPCMFGKERSSSQMAQLGNLVDKCSVVFYRINNGDSDIVNFYRDFDYAAQWGKPIIVQINPFGKQTGKDKLHPFTDEEQKKYFDVIFEARGKDKNFKHPINIDSIYCWSDTLRKFKDGIVPRDMETSKDIEDYLIKFLSNLKEAVLETTSSETVLEKASA